MAANSSAKNHCVLVVDDDRDICETLEMILGSQGYQVLTASDGREALTRLRSGARPFLILLDLMMPGMNGMQFRQEQLRDPDLAHIPVVVISGHAQVREMALSMGVEKIEKPFDLGNLLESVHRFVPARLSGTRP